MIGEPAVPALIDAIEAPPKHKDHRIRIGAVVALGRIGPYASDAVPALIKYIDDEKSKGYVIETLGMIGPKAKEAVPVIKEAMKDRKHRRFAEEALKQIDLEAAAKAGMQ